MSENSSASPRAGVITTCASAVYPSPLPSRHHSTAGTAWGTGRCPLQLCRAQRSSSVQLPLHKQLTGSSPSSPAPFPKHPCGSHTGVECSSGSKLRRTINSGKPSGQREKIPVGNNACSAHGRENRTAASTGSRSLLWEASTPTAQTANAVCCPVRTNTPLGRHRSALSHKNFLRFATQTALSLPCSRSPAFCPWIPKPALAVQAAGFPRSRGHSPAPAQHCGAAEPPAAAKDVTAALQLITTMCDHVTNHQDSCRCHATLRKDPSTLQQEKLPAEGTWHNNQSPNHLHRTGPDGATPPACCHLSHTLHRG